MATSVINLFLNITIISNYMNSLRFLHSVPPLTENRNLSITASIWGVHMATTNKFVHSDYSYGENLAMSWYNPKDKNNGTSYVIDAINRWYSEYTNYNFRFPGYSTGQFTTGHFTQLVWKSSSEYGISAVYDNKKCVYVVMEYNPAGNDGAYLTNVFPVKLAFKKSPPLARRVNSRLYI